MSDPTTSRNKYSRHERERFVILRHNYYEHSFLCFSFCQNQNTWSKAFSISMKRCKNIHSSIVMVVLFVLLNWNVNKVIKQSQPEIVFPDLTGPS